MSGLPHISEDLSELIALLNSHKVEFLIVGPMQKLSTPSHGIRLILTFFLTDR